MSFYILISVLKLLYNPIAEHMNNQTLSIFDKYLNKIDNHAMLDNKLKGDTNELVLGTSIGFNLDQQSNGSHIYLPYYNGDSLVIRKLNTNQKNGNH